MRRYSVWAQGILVGSAAVLLVTHWTYPQVHALPFVSVLIILASGIKLAERWRA